MPKTGSPSPNTDAALIVGFSIQGLAVARALARRGVPVYALERNRKIPSVRTRFAQVTFTDRIESEELVETLLELRPTLPHDNVVLFAASDRTVRTVGEQWPRLAPHYLMSWAESADLVKALSVKSNLPVLCDAAGVLYPRTVVYRSAEDRAKFSGLRYPVGIKPAQPPGPFKVIVVRSEPALLQLLEQYAQVRPMVIQEWIEGGDETLYFCTLFMDGDRELARLTGRKLQSSPPGTGRGVVMESHWDPAVYEAGRRFAYQLGLRGQIAMEFKRDSAGRYWFIEPNAGRTEYCIDLAIQTGIDLPWLEFCYARGQPCNEVSDLTPDDWSPVVWYDTEREPFCYWRWVAREKTLRPHRKRPTFPFLGRGDPKPLARASALLARKIGRAVWHRVTLSRSQSPSVEVETA